LSENECDIALKNLDLLMTQTWNQLSESDTRAKIIDPLFKDVLGWNEKDILREPFFHSGYLDYVFCIDGVRKFLIEAKKEGVEFFVPLSTSEKERAREYSLSGALMTNEKVKKAVEQARQYCVDAGVRYAIVTNGHQFIIFEGFKENCDWRTGKCIVFHSPQGVHDDFWKFFSILNRKEVAKGSLRKCISKQGFNFDYLCRPIDRLHSKDSIEPRNYLAPFIQPFVDYAFFDIIDEYHKDMLDECYVIRRQYADADEQISYQFDCVPSFAKKYGTKAVIESLEKAGTFQEFFEESERFINKDVKTGTLMLLMGGVGSGKTTFLHHFFNFVVKRPQTTAWFYVDFLKTLEPSKIEEHVYKSIISDFEKKYASRLKRELELLNLGTLNPDFKTVLVLFSLLMREGFDVSLVLDNADQHEHQYPKYQESVILVAKFLTESLKTVTILALREETFFKSSRSGVLTAIPLPPLHISSPMFEDLIRFRLDYLLNLLKRDDDEISQIVGKSIRLGTKKELVTMFFEIVRNSLRSKRRKGQEILGFLDDVSGRDMRTALGFFRTFLVSGNTDVAEMLGIEEVATRRGRGSHYEIPVHHVIKSIILQHSTLYSMTNSPVLNLFDFDPNISDSHFLNLHILDYLQNRISGYSRHGRGFVEIDEIIQEGERVGIFRPALEDSLIRMADYGLVEFENQSREGFATANFVKITNTGAYYLTELSHTFQYLDLVMIDTPISDSAVVDELLKHVVELRKQKTDKDILERFYRTEVFLDYLLKREEIEAKTKSEYQYSDLTRRLFMQEIIQSYREKKEYILSKQ
jgi:hypothetical protein